MHYSPTLSGFYRRSLRELRRVRACTRSVLAPFIICFLSLASSPIALLQYFSTRGGVNKEDKVRVEIFQLAMLAFNFLILFYLLTRFQPCFLFSLCRVFDLLCVFLSLVFVPHRFYRTGRALLLLLSEYLEIVVIFAIFYLHFQSTSSIPLFSVGGSPRLLRPSEAFLFSLGTFATFGSGDITLRSDIAASVPILRSPLLYMAWQALCIIVVIIYVVLRISNDAGRAK